MSFPRKTLERLLILMTAFFTSPATFADWNSAPEKVVRDHPTWIFTPNSTLPNGKHGLMVVLHGCDQTNDQLKQFGNLEGAANENGLVVAVPSVGDNPWPDPAGGCWDYNAGTDGSHHAADIINLTRTLLRRTALNIDSAQVYVVGLSSGGALSLLLGCMAPDLYAGVGAIASPSVGSAQPGATDYVPETNADDAIQKCNALGGKRSPSFATQVANIAYGDMDKNAPDADFPNSPDDTSHPGQYAVVSVNWSDDNIRILRSIYGDSALGAAINIQSNMGVERDATTNGRTQLAELVLFNVGHAWPAGTGQPNSANSGGRWIAQTGLSYPQYIADWFIRNNLRAK
jgi:poly(3-hydroxybutyrate) depolymerase